MSLLKFLQTATVEDVKTAPRTGGGARKQWNPGPAIVAIRVWKDGSIFPSQAAVDKFDLEYKKTKITLTAVPKKEGDEKDPAPKKSYEFPDGTGNGLDFIDSRHWAQVKGDGALLFVAVVPKNAGKVDMFNTVAYEEDGTPKISVMDQGAVTFGKDILLSAIEEVYGVKFNRVIELGEEEITDGVDFVDMVIFEKLGEFDLTEKYSTKIANFPKKISRGKDAGELTYSRRENAKVYGFAPAKDVLADYQEDVKQEEPVEEKELEKV